MIRQFNRPVAALMMFTKLPLWKIFPNIPGDAYRYAVTWWPFCGWLTGCIYGMVYLLCTIVLPALPSAIIALGTRLMLTGAYHEDGLADFFDGFGGGIDKERILSIMKDSHIGTYGVIALVMFIALQIALVSSVVPMTGAIMIICADPWSKFCAGRMVSFLPYARRSNISKNQVSYPKPDIKDTCIALTCGILPMMIICFIDSSSCMSLLSGSLTSAAVSALLFHLMKKKIGGYTGDCCGAVYIISESAFCLSFIFTYFLSI